MNAIPSLPPRPTIDPRITEILRQRAEQGVSVRKTLPLRAEPRVSAQSVPVPQPMPSPQAAETVTVGDDELGALLSAVLPRIDSLVRQTIGAVRSDGRLTMAEALALAPEVRNIISSVIGEMLPQIKGTSARNLVILVLSVLIRQYVSPYLPAFLRPYLTAATLKALVNGLEFAYQNWIKPRLKATTVQPLMAPAPM